MDATSERDRSCEERLPEHLAGRLEDLQEMNEAMRSDDDEEREEAYTRANEYGLGLSVHKVVRWDLGTGGPGDWLEFHVDQDDGLIRVEYVFQDWFDGARATLEGSQHDVAADFYEYNLRGYVETL